MASRTKDIRFSLQIKAPPEQVYRALTSARELCRWWLAFAETDARNLGRVRMVWPKDVKRNGGLPRRLGEMEAVYVDLEPARKVAWMCGLAARKRGIPPLQTFFINPKAGGSEVSLVHMGFPARGGEKRFHDFNVGWEDALAKLKLYVETGKTLKAETLRFSDLERLTKASK